MKLTYRPIDTWDRPETEPRRPSPFDAAHGQTLTLLEREVGQLGADNAVVLLDVRESDIRQDGEFRARAVVRGPRVIVALDSKHGPLKYHCDRFTHWEANLRAIALGLEALRRVERYGITSRGEQYRGFAQLPAGVEMGAPMSRSEAARVLVDLGDEEGLLGYNPDDVIVSDDITEELWTIAVRLHHPDTGGNADLFRRANEARAVLQGAIA